MPGKGLRGIFKKRQRDKEETEVAGKPHDNEGRDLSMQYVGSPSALEYPGVKKSETPKVQTQAQEQSIDETDKGSKSQEDLPRCPQCGWAIGYEDNSCMNCGFKLR